MSRMCEVCGKKVTTGNNNITHPEKKKTTSNHKTRRVFRPNLFKKAFFNPETGEKMKIKTCAKCIRTISKKLK